jgi:hypothetical protein
VWSNSGGLAIGGTLTVAGGGALFTAGCTIGLDSAAVALVTGSGSVWKNIGSLACESHSKLIVSNGAAVYSDDGIVEGQAYGQAVVTGSGSVWNMAGTLRVDRGSFLSIGDGAVVVASSVGGGYMSIGVGNSALYVTNGAGVIGLEGYFGGGITVNQGTVTANQLIVERNSQSGSISYFTFNSGLLTTSGTFVTNTQSFAVGDGAGAATFHVAGGFHSFADGLQVSNNGSLTGCGTIDGSVTVATGAIVVADCGGSLTFTGIVINNGTLRAINGSVLEFYGPVVNNGLIDITGGTTNFHSTFINNGSIISGSPAFQITGIAQQDNNILITWLTSPEQTNELQATAGGPGGSYSTNNFTAIFAVTNTVGSVTNYLDIGGATNTPSRYYRVRLVQ